MTKVLFITLAPSQQDQKAGRLFFDAAGAEFYRMLTRAGIDRKDCEIISIFPFPIKHIENLLIPKKEIAKDYTIPYVSRGHYLAPKYIPYLTAVFEKIKEVDPNVICTLGNFPAWLLSGEVSKHFTDQPSTTSSTMLTKIRGWVFNCMNRLLIPTYDPATILREWNLRPITIFDLQKVARHIDKRSFMPTVRHLCLEPTLDEVRSYLKLCENVELLSFDIETKNKTITCIGFSADPLSAICIPFYDPRKADGNYWSFEDEKTVFKLVKNLIECQVAKLAQNGLYDIQYLTSYGMRIANYREDTMIKHHSLYSEMPKGLAFLASIYLDEQPWKLIRNTDDFKVDA